MEAPVFLDLFDVIEIHSNQLVLYGGDPGVRDVELLQSGIAMPSAGIQGRFLHKDIFEMVAAYLFYIVQNHPFIDGNKRTGAASALVFLFMNDIELNADEDEFYEIVLGVAEGKTGKSEIAEFLRRNVEK